MREYQIKIEPFTYIALLNVNIIRQVKEHGTAQVSMRIRDSDREGYLLDLVAETWVTIKAVGENEEEHIIFQGIVKHFELQVNSYDTIVEMELVSGSYLMDINQHFRVFQNPSIGCMDLSDILLKGYDEASASNFAGNEKIGHIVIQYRETDWELITRIAEEKDKVLIPETGRKGIKYCIGLPTGNERVLENGTKIHYTVNIETYNQKKKDGNITLKVSEALEILFESRDIYEMGDWIVLHGQRYYIAKIVSRYEGAELMHTYKLQTKAYLLPIQKRINNCSGCSFDATILGVKKDQVIVDVEDDENALNQEKYWFSYGTVYSSSDGTGWYCMPEIGDHVRLYVPNKEAESFVISSVHMETNKARQNPDYKSFKTKYGKEILFTPDTLMITNNQGMMIELSDSEGIYIASDKDILIQAANNLTVASQSSSLLIAAEECVEVKQGSTTMTMKEDILFTGGEFRIQ